MEQARNARSADIPDMRIDDALVEKVVQANHIEVPQDLVDDEVRMMVLELNHQLKYESLASGRYIGFTQAEMADRLAEIRAEAFKLVRTRLALKAIIAAERLKVTTAELEEEAQAIAVRQQMPIEMVKGFLGENLESLRDDLLVRKAIAFIEANA